MMHTTQAQVYQASTFDAVFVEMKRYISTTACAAMPEYSRMNRYRYMMGEAWPYAYFAIFQSEPRSCSEVRSLMS